MSEEAWNNMTLTEEQTMLVETVRKFVADVVAPRAHAVDKESRYPEDTLKEMSDLGLLSLLVPEDLGGAGMGALAHALALEELGKGCGSTGLALLAHTSLATRFLLEAADDEQKSRWIPQLASGEKIGAFAFAEPESVAAAAAAVVPAAAPAAEKTNKGYTLNGSRSLVTGAGRADLFIWIVRGGPAASGSASAVSAFVVEKGAPGLTVEPGAERVGMRGVDWGTVRLEACTVPTAHRIGELGGVARAFARTLDSGHAGLAALAVGMAERAFELARRYAKERIAFGKPLAAQQAVALKLAEMRMKIDVTRHLARHAARLDEQAEDFGREALTAKVAATEAATFCGDEAIQIHGGYGFTTEYTVERIYRDAKVSEVIHATNEQCRLDLARWISS